MSDVNEWATFEFQDGGKCPHRNVVRIHLYLDGVERGISLDSIRDFLRWCDAKNKQDTTIKNVETFCRLCPRLCSLPVNNCPYIVELCKEITGLKKELEKRNEAIQDHCATIIKKSNEDILNEITQLKEANRQLTEKRDDIAVQRDNALKCIDDLKRRLDNHDRDIELLINSINLMVRENPFLNVDATFPGLCSGCARPRRCFPRICPAMPKYVYESLTQCNYRIPKEQP
jgi:DNA-binding transcriptional MerR regulator